MSRRAKLFPELFGPTNTTTVPGLISRGAVIEFAPTKNFSRVIFKLPDMSSFDRRMIYREKSDYDNFTRIRRADSRCEMKAREPRSVLRAFAR